MEPIRYTFETHDWTPPEGLTPEPLCYLVLHPKRHEVVAHLNGRKIGDRSREMLGQINYQVRLFEAGERQDWTAQKDGTFIRWLYLASEVRGGEE